MHTLLSKLWDKRTRLSKTDKGFTLIELLVVVVILGVLIAIAIPLYLNYRKGANDAAAQSDLRNALSVMEVCNTDNNGYGAVQTAKSATFSPCTGQTINLSSGTTMSVNTVAATGTTAASYVAFDTNSGGSGKSFCYDSKVGGSVKTTPAAAYTTTTEAC